MIFYVLYLVWAVLHIFATSCSPLINDNIITIVAAPPADSPTLNAVSLGGVAKALKGTEAGLQLAMLLNIPTVTLVRIQLFCQEQGLPDDDMLHRMLLAWRAMRGTAKDRDKVSDLKRALDFMGRSTWSDVIEEKFQSGAELTAELLPNPVV